MILNTESQLLKSIIQDLTAENSDLKSQMFLNALNNLLNNQTVHGISLKGKKSKKDILDAIKHLYIKFSNL
jgi:hypothetical protein